MLIYFFKYCFVGALFHTLLTLFHFLLVQDREEVSNIIAPFASGMVGLMGSLVQRWTKLQRSARAEMANQFSGVADQFVPRGATSSVPGSSAQDVRPSPGFTVPATRATRGRSAAVVRATRASTSAPKDVSPSLPEDTDTDSWSSDDDSRDEDIGDKYICAPRKGKEIVDNQFISADDMVVSQNVGGQSFACGDHDVSVDDIEHSVDADEPVAAEEPGGVHEPAPAPVDAAAEVSSSQTSLIAAGSVGPQGTVGSEESNLAEVPTLIVYKKKKLKTVGDKDKSIRNIVMKELNITSEMIQSNANLNVAGVSKKSVPKRYKPC